MSEVRIEREPFSRALHAEMLPLLTLHWREIAHYPDIPLDADVDRYCQAEEAGILRFFAARIDGKLVGYACFFVGPALHYKGSIQALQDVLYVDPAYRCSTIGLRLIKHTEIALYAEGVQAVMQHVKEAHPALAVILESRGYDRIDVIYGKRLDRMEA